MSNFDDVFNDQSKERKEKRPFDKAAWIQKKQEERKEVYALVDRTAEEVGRDGAQFQAYLDVQSQFEQYSPTNALLILAQMPSATQVKDYDGWKCTGASVQKKPTFIRILEPGKEFTREDGTRGTNYNVKRVFDVSQTSMKDKTEPQVRLDDRVLLKALISKSPVPIQTVDTLPNGLGAIYDHDQQVIFVRRGMGADQIFRSVSTELAHAELAQMREDYDRSGVAFAAYSASYMLCKKYGVDVSGYQFRNLPEQLQNGTTQEIRAALTEIRDTAGSISGRMVRALEKNRTQKSKGQER